MSERLTDEELTGAEMRRARETSRALCASTVALEMRRVPPR